MLDKDRITIRDLTYEQIELLDQMWAIDTAEELDKFMKSQPEEVQHKVRVLQEMLHLAYSDDMVDQMESYPDAEKLVRNMMK